MERRSGMGDGMSRHTILSSGNRGNNPSNRRGTPEPNHNGNSSNGRRSSRSEFDYRFGYGSTVLPIWYHIGTAVIAITTIVIAVVFGIIGE